MIYCFTSAVVVAMDPEHDVHEQTEALLSESLLPQEYVQDGVCYKM